MINENWCYCQSKNFSERNDTVRHSKAFRMIPNQMFCQMFVAKGDAV